MLRRGVKSLFKLYKSSGKYRWTKNKSRKIKSCYFVNFQDRINLYLPAKAKLFSLVFELLTETSFQGCFNWKKLTQTPSQPVTSQIFNCWHGSRGCAAKKSNSAPKACSRSCGGIPALFNSFRADSVVSIWRMAPAWVISVQIDNRFANKLDMAQKFKEAWIKNMRKIQM